jgi:Protein of unknown function (DUF2793)
MPNNTDRIGLPYILQSQSQKEVTHNDGLGLLDMLVQAVVQSISLNTPPVSPVLGDCYIVGGSPTGVWVGNSNKIAQAITGGWRYYIPFNGLSVFNITDSTIYRFNGTAWASTAISLLQNLSMLGINATADATNKLSVNSSAILFNNIGNGVQVKLNKNAAADSASFLFQNGFSGRSEIGLTGDDDFHFKVSPDGSTWYDGLVIDRNNGRLKSIGISFDGGTNVLSNYTVGTFTPILKGLTTAGTPTYVRQVGKYTRVGDRVDIFIDLAISAIGGMVGDVIIDGLPFTALSSPISFPAIVGAAFNYTLSAAGQDLKAHALGSNARLRLMKSSITGYSNMNVTELGATFSCVIQLTYKV